MRSELVCAATSLSLALAGCGARGRPPQIAFDPPMMQAAIRVVGPSAPAIIPRPGPLDASDALSAVLPPPARAGEERSPSARVDAANRAALREPSSSQFMNAVQVYSWAPGGVYRIYTAPEQVTDIALEPGESLIAVAAGDTVRWIVGDTTSGAGPSRRVHVLVKPTAPGLATNLVITTDRRSYHLRAQSTARTAMAAVSWNYPQDQLIALASSEGGSPPTAAPALQIESIRFRYRITGDRPPWRPLRAFDDGRQVFIEFPGRLDQEEAPPLFVLGAGGDGELVNYRVRGNFYVVDRLFAAAELRLGAGDQQVVRIERIEVQTPGRGSPE